MQRTEAEERAIQGRARFIPATADPGQRALEKREPKLHEQVKTALFVKSSTTSATVNTALAELCALKRPDGIFFGRKGANTNILPFEDATTLEFWSHKNDASFVLVGSHSKKRPNALCIARMFDHLVLDMLEVGIERAVSMSEFKTLKASVGAKPLFHFAGELFDSHPHFIQLKSLLLDIFHGEITPSINLAGLGHVISVSHGPVASTSTAPAPVTSIVEDTSVASMPVTALPTIHFRVFGIQLLKSGQREPRVQLIEHGPSLDLRIRRSQPAAEEVWKRAMRHKPHGPQTAEGAEKKRKRTKNVDVDEMGDKVGRIYVGTQDLNKLQSRKIKGLRKERGVDEEDAGDADGPESAGDDGEVGDADDGISTIDGERAPKRRR